MVIRRYLTGLVGSLVGLAVACCALVVAPAPASADQDCLTRAGAKPYLSTDEGGSIYRLYCAMFQRPPDGPGFDYWLMRHWESLRLVDIAELFTSSDEVQLTYGGLSRDEFIAQVYLNVLGRQYDQAGFDYWKAELDAGRVGRGYLLLLFSDSREHVLRTRSATSFANCAEVREADAAPIHRGEPGYSTDLDRDGDGIACEV